MARPEGGRSVSKGWPVGGRYPYGVVFNPRRRLAGVVFNRPQTTRYGLSPLRPDQGRRKAGARPYRPKVARKRLDRVRCGDRVYVWRLPRVNYLNYAALTGVGVCTIGKTARRTNCNRRGCRLLAYEQSARLHIVSERVAGKATQ